MRAPETVISTVSEKTRVSVEEIKGTSRTRDVSYARRLAAWEMHQEGHSLRQIANALHKDHKSVSHAIRKVAKDKGVAMKARHPNEGKHRKDIETFLADAEAHKDEWTVPDIAAAYRIPLDVAWGRIKRAGIKMRSARERTTPAVRPTMAELRENTKALLIGEMPKLFPPHLAGSGHSELAR